MVSCTSFIILAMALGSVCSGRVLSSISIPPATAVPFNPLLNQTKPGVASFLQNNPDYSTFLSIVQSDPTYSKILTGAWSQGVTNNTVLVPTNAAVAAGFAQLGATLGVPAEPARYIEIAAVNNVGMNYTATPLNAAIANLMAAILNSHVLTEPINFFSDSKVLGANKADPVVLPTSGILNAEEAPVAFNNGTDADAGALILVSQPTGLLEAPTPIPKLYAQQLGGSKTVLYLYQIDALLVSSRVEKGVTAGGSTTAALSLIQESLVGA